MGFFSWKCRGCGRSILAPYAQGLEWMSQAVVLTEDGEVIHGEYDGYGRVGLYSVIDNGQNSDLWHRGCWMVAGQPKYRGPADHAEDQGYFIEPAQYEGLDDPGKTGVPIPHLDKLNHCIINPLEET